MTKRKDDHQRFYEWCKNRTAAERILQEMAFDFEGRYFTDLRLLSATVRRRLFECKVELDGEWIKTWDDPPPIGIHGWIFKYCRMRDALGRCVGRRKTVFIHPDGDHTMATIIHEMIHAYLFQIPDSFREWLTLDLHERLAMKINPARLRKLIDASTHRLVHNCAHGVLFLLKSLDIDLRRKWNLRTKFAYGRTEMFSNVR